MPTVILLPSTRVIWGMPVPCSILHWPACLCWRKKGGPLGWILEIYGWKGPWGLRVLTFYFLPRIRTLRQCCHPAPPHLCSMMPNCHKPQGKGKLTLGGRKVRNRNYTKYWQRHWPADLKATSVGDLKTTSQETGQLPKQFVWIPLNIKQIINKGTLKKGKVNGQISRTNPRPGFTLLVTTCL